ncbi:hypothetical protein [Glutamicibacter protophormiae]|uniref:Uncharacterized protein n=1 Tax=Glutamicibacter protophormiae TaxID=37930 RepID=A0ABS4XSD4_GLUPR|nr:hypothetical protein [Glutamicibacter protophormiae]MBP2399416.1 hypothetical protein [Glutamicibacter protophormiae]
MSFSVYDVARLHTIFAEQRYPVARAGVPSSAILQAGYQDTAMLWTRAYFLRQASKIVPGTVEAITRFLDQKEIEAQGFRSCVNIFTLGKGMNRILMERTCQEFCASALRLIV